MTNNNYARRITIYGKRYVFEFTVINKLVLLIIRQRSKLPSISTLYLVSFVINSFFVRFEMLKSVHGAPKTTNANFKPQLIKNDPPMISDAVRYFFHNIIITSRATAGPNSVAEQCEIYVNSFSTDVHYLNIQSCA